MDLRAILYIMLEMGKASMHMFQLSLFNNSRKKGIVVVTLKLSMTFIDVMI